MEDQLEEAINDFEREVMGWLLRGGQPALATLRQQLAVAKVVSRDVTTAGFFTQFKIQPTAPRLPPPGHLWIQDVQAEVSGLEHGAGFMLYVTNGVLDTLEGYSYMEPWPPDARVIRAYYIHPERPGGAGLIETAERDLVWALRP